MFVSTPRPVRPQVGRLVARGQEEGCRRAYDCSGNDEMLLIVCGPSSSPSVMTLSPSPASFPVVAHSNDGTGSPNDQPDSPRPGDYLRKTFSLAPFLILEKTCAR